ncbi:MAG: N-acetylmuramoyl-L-alanine amidase [Candidatus Eisenbacteria sp.]|nr:N-acetylmuramoyl-L-alanine amidase [Candidatus Eisenbacteria bacterium]
MSQFRVDSARIVFEGSDFVLYDVADLLPRHKNFPHGTEVRKPDGSRAIPAHWKYREIQGRKIDILYSHQTAGAVTTDGFSALTNTYNFMSSDPSYTAAGKWTGRGRGWPSGSYTYYIPYNPIMWKGKVVIFKCWDHDWITWHSGHNNNSIAIVCQGYFLSRHMRTFEPRRGCPSGKPSDSQQLALAGFYMEFAVDHLGIKPKNICGHCDSPRPKPACPGDLIERLYRAVQQSKGKPVMPDPMFLMFPPLPGLLPLDHWADRQAALVLLGHDLGPYGPQKNGVDGDPGYLTRMAIETQEENLGLVVDGYWDDVFNYHMKVQLLARTRTQHDLDELK